MRRDMGTLVALSPRGVAAEKLALPAPQDGEVDRAERWVRLALRLNASDIVNGDALLTLARIRIAQGCVSEAHKVLEQARRVHPHCPRWAAVEAAVR